MAGLPAVVLPGRWPLGLGMPMPGRKVRCPMTKAAGALHVVRCKGSHSVNLPLNSFLPWGPRRKGKGARFRAPAIGASVCHRAAQPGGRSRNAPLREARFSGLDVSSSKPWAGPSQRGFRLSWVSAPKTTLPCLFKGSSASLKCCCRFAPRGVDRIGSSELSIFSEFEASEPSLRACCACII